MEPSPPEGDNGETLDEPSGGLLHESLPLSMLKVLFKDAYIEQEMAYEAHTNHYISCSACYGAASKDKPCEAGRPLYDKHKAADDHLMSIDKVLLDKMDTEEHGDFVVSVSREHCAANDHDGCHEYYEECPMCGGYSFLGIGCFTCRIVFEPDICDTSYCKWWETSEGKQLLP